MTRAGVAGFSAATSPNSAAFPSSAPLPTDDPEAAPTAVDPLLGSAITLSVNEQVFPLIQRIKHEVESVVDTALSWDAFRSPSINFSVVRPLVVKLSRGDRPAISLIFALLVCRAHFVDRSDEDLAFAAVNDSRADLCELLAIKLLSAYGTAPGSLELLHVLTTPFSPFAGATLDMFAPEEGVDEDELARLKVWGQGEDSNALELSIFSKAKRFVKSPLVQQVIKAIYQGEVIYSPESNHALVQDNYKSKPIVELYDWRRRPFLDHHRLRVPRIRTRLEFLAFAIMLGLFLLTQATYQTSQLNLWELLFIFWGIGFAIDEWSAIQENGVTTYFGGAFNTLDSVFVLLFAAYLGMRLAGLHNDDHALSKLALDTLSLGGCVLLPRVTISLLKDNVVLLALSKMVREFIVFMGLSVLAASGFLVTLRLLSHGSWDVGHISWLLLRMHLGSAFLGFDVAQQFHPVFGPILIVVFSVLSQTLLLTILISLLTNTFSAVQANAETELLFQKALRTVERAKADPLTCYVAPVNTIALIVLFPLRFIASPYVLHKSQVYLCRLLNLPTLLVLALHTRTTHASRSPLYLASERTRRAWASLPRGLYPSWDGAVEVMAERVFERAVTVEGRRVASMDDDGAEEEGVRTPPASKAVEEMEREAAQREGNGKGKGRPPPLATTPTKAPTQRKPAGAAQRLGSLSSPLAKLFGPSAVSGTGSAETATTSKEVEQRLARIEEALQVLLGEVVKTGGVGGERKDLPLTSLTGEKEPDYTADE
ncbi:hypothetical protein JCM10207_007928 [Rhodosporidiobolus poonsookiae]